jgi:hypothetical protein
MLLGIRAVGARLTGIVAASAVCGRAEALSLKLEAAAKPKSKATSARGIILASGIAASPFDWCD